MIDDAQLALFVERLPWLAELGPDRLATLDRSDWHLPSEASLVRLSQVGDALGVHLMSYRRNAVASGNGLCTRIVAASLSTDDLGRIACVEAESPECIVVAYRRPLDLRQAEPTSESEGAEDRRP